MPDHGTRANYQRGCRCEPCRAANRDYQRAYMRDHYRTIPAEPTRLDVIAMHEGGETLRAIAARTGYSASFVNKLAAGTYKRVHPETADDFAAALRGAA